MEDFPGRGGNAAESSRLNRPARSLNRADAVDYLLTSERIDRVNFKAPQIRQGDETGSALRPSEKATRRDDASLRSDEIWSHTQDWLAFQFNRPPSGLRMPVLVIVFASALLWFSWFAKGKSWLV